MEAFNLLSGQQRYAGERRRLCRQPGSSRRTLAAR
jgi:hypothetical protein